jgi:hypothetical protein
MHACMYACMYGIYVHRISKSVELDGAGCSHVVVLDVVFTIAIFSIRYGYEQ